MKINLCKTLLVGLLSTLLTSTFLYAGSQWRTEPAAKSALQEIDTAFGKGFRLHASNKGSLRAVKKLDAGKYAGKKVVLDAQFKFICHKNIDIIKSINNI
jgi:ribosomal protein L11 methylase PrmA